MEYWNKYKGIIITAIIIGGIVWAIWYFGKKAGQKYVPDNIVIPPDLQAPGTPDKFNPGPYTDALFRDLDCIFCMHNEKPYKDALTLSNSQLAAIYNDWNKRYASEFDGMTIIQAIYDERAFYNPPWATVSDALAKRFKSLYGAQG